MKNLNDDLMLSPNELGGHAVLAFWMCMFKSLIYYTQTHKINQDVLQLCSGLLKFFNTRKLQNVKWVWFAFSNSTWRDSPWPPWRGAFVGLSHTWDSGRGHTLISTLGEIRNCLHPQVSERANLLNTLMSPIWMSKCPCQRSIILILWFFLKTASQKGSVACSQHLCHSYRRTSLPSCLVGQRSIYPVHLKASKLFEYKF